MKLSKLIEHVGNENVEMQNIMHSSPTLRVCKHDGQVTFCTEKAKVRDLIQQTCGVGGFVASGKWTALVLWVPTDRLPDVKEQNTEAE